MPAARAARSSGHGATRPRAPWTTSVDDAVLAKMQFGELAVGIRQLVADGSGSLGPAAADLRLLEFEAPDRLDADAMLGARDGIHDGLAALFDVTGHVEPRAAAVDVHDEVDVREHRVVHLA